MNALRQIAAGMLRQDPAIAPPREAARYQTQGTEDVTPTGEGTFLRWNGQKLTQDGEPHFAIWVCTDTALAEALLRLTCTDLEPTEAEARAFAAEVLGYFDLDAAFAMHPNGPRRWLEAGRVQTRRT